jgi:single-stranded-DNA-specific exonuclease
MSQWLDLVALGTVADVVPLDKNNRVLVNAGLKVLRSGKGCAGIRALFDVAGRDWRTAVASDMGFVIGPRINAAGRLDDISHGIRCLLEENAAEAAVYAAELDALNRDRRLIQQEMQEQAEELMRELDERFDDLPWGMVLYDDTWHQGVVGLLASKIKERLHRPVIAFALTDGGELKGSGRSIPGLNLRDALDAVATRHTGLLSKFGGHAMAAGLSLQHSDLAWFERAFDDEVRRQLNEADLASEVWTDGKIPLSDITLQEVKRLQHMAPWGQSFPEPQFEGEFEVLEGRVLKERHLKLQLRFIGREAGKHAVSAADLRSKAIDAIWFNADLDRYEQLRHLPIRLVYRLDINRFRGNENLQLVVTELLD